MTAYLTADQLAERLAPELRSELDALDEALTVDLLEGASGDVDLAVGGPRSLTTGRALDTSLLTAAQLAAIQRATAIAAAIRLDDPETAGGRSDYLPSSVTVARPAQRPPADVVIAALVGLGLIARSGCAEPDEDPEVIVE